MCHLEATLIFFGALVFLASARAGGALGSVFGDVPAGPVELTLYGLVNLVLVGLLVCGGVLVGAGRGRGLLLAANLAAIAYSVYLGTRGAGWITVTYLVMPVLAVGLVFAGGTGQWLAHRHPAGSDRAR